MPPFFPSKKNFFFLRLTLMRDKNKISDYDLQAFVDGELGEDDAARVRAAVAKCCELRIRLSALQEQKELLRAWWDQFRQEH